jgi:hypothetical protein
MNKKLVTGRAGHPNVRRHFFLRFGLPYPRSSTTSDLAETPSDKNQVRDLQLEQFLMSARPERSIFLIGDRLDPECMSADCSTGQTRGLP